MNTLPVENISAEGATLRANLAYLGTTPIHNHGFIWGTKASLKATESVKINLGSLGSTGSFEQEVSTGLLKDSVYYVKAFVEAGSYTVYGEITNFTSAGAGAPVISGIEPESGAGGDTIRIHGSGLSYLPSKTIVKFGNSYYGTTITSSDSSLQVIVPFGIPEVSVTVSVTIANQTSAPPGSFQLRVPEIISFAPTEVTLNDLVTVTGQNFHKEKIRNSVFVGGQSMEVTASSPTQLIFRVSSLSGIASPQAELVIVSDQRPDTAHVPLLIKPPVITSISPLSGHTGTTVRIAGSNFNPSLPGVMLGESMATVLSATATTIDARIEPSGMVASRIAPVKVTVAGQTVASAQNFTFTDPLLTKANVPVNLSLLLSANNKVYGVETGVTPNKIYEYDPATNRWSEGKVIAAATTVRFGPAGFSIGTKIYVGLGWDSNIVVDNSFWEYDLISGSWQPIADFPGNGSTDPEGFAWNNHGYVISTEETSNMWRYNPSMNDWTPLQDFPANFNVQNGHRIDASFISGGQLYGLAADGSTGPELFYRYDFISDTWIRLNDFHSTSISWPKFGAGFTTSHGSYVAFGNFLYKYDVLADSWTEMELGGLINGGGIVTAQDKAYVWCGSCLGFYEYDADYEN